MQGFSARSPVIKRAGSGNGSGNGSGSGEGKRGARRDIHPHGRDPELPGLSLHVARARGPRSFRAMMDGVSWYYGVVDTNNRNDAESKLGFLFVEGVTLEA